MLDESSVPRLIIRLAVPEDIAEIERLDSFSSSPTRHIHREMEKYFGSVDPSTHERTLIFLAELSDRIVAKAELMLPPYDEQAEATVGYIKRVIVHPDARKQNLARSLMEYIIAYARTETRLNALDLHVWEENTPAIRLYESLDFTLQHRELYFHLPL